MLAYLRMAPKKLNQHFKNIFESIFVRFYILQISEGNYGKMMVGLATSSIGTFSEKRLLQIHYRQIDVCMLVHSDGCIWDYVGLWLQSGIRNATQRGYLEGLR